MARSGSWPSSSNAAVGNGLVDGSLVCHIRLGFDQVHQRRSESAKIAHSTLARHYQLTPAGHDLFNVCGSLGEWGARWLQIAPEHLDPFVALWSIGNAIRRERLPDRRVVIRFDFTGGPRRERFWLLIEHGDTEICKTYPGLDEDLFITAEAEAFVKWHAGQLSWAEATRNHRIQLHGPSWLVRAFPTWNARSLFAHVKPVPRPTARSAT